jgi:hypothetical protein
MARTYKIMPDGTRQPYHSGTGNEVKDVTVNGVSVVNSSTGVAAVLVPAPPTPAQFLSSDLGNVSQIGSDQKIFTPAGVVQVYEAATAQAAEIYSLANPTVFVYVKK